MDRALTRYTLIDNETGRSLTFAEWSSLEIEEIRNLFRNELEGKLVPMPLPKRHPEE